MACRNELPRALREGTEAPGVAKHPQTIGRAADDGSVFRNAKTTLERERRICNFPRLSKPAPQSAGSGACFSSFSFGRQPRTLH